jgi:hypothetical protein
MQGEPPIRKLRHNRVTTWVLAGASLVLLAFAYALLGLRVDNTIHDADVQAINQLALGTRCDRPMSDFAGELDCVQAVQRAVQAIGRSACAAKVVPIEPSDLLQRGYACCYERARFIEKALRHHGFQTRHVFLIEPFQGWSIANMLPLGQASHAATEVLTRRGWMGVDSIEAFILVDGAGMPVDYRTAISSATLRSRMKPQDFYERRLDIIHGLYSRHGQFFGPPLPGPEFALEELRWNFTN